LVFVGGEAGVGKTTLAAALASHAADRLHVRRGACDNITTAAALGPVGEAVPELEHLLDEVTPVNRLRLFRRLRGLLAERPTLLLLDDVHWADEATLDLLRFLGRRLRDAPLLLVLTFRSDEAIGAHPLAVLRGDLATAAGVSQAVLAPLSRVGVAELIGRSGSTLDPASVHRSTGGNPFFVTELLAVGEQRLPATVRDAVLARASRLSEEGRDVLAAAAIVGQRAGLALLMEVSGRPAAALDECVAHGMLVAEGDGWSFRHELARLAIEETLTPSRRTRLHAEALAALLAVGRSDGRRLAHHAAGCGDGRAVLEHAPPAAEQAARLGAHREAAELYRLALRFADRPTPEQARLNEALSYECYLTDELAEAHAARSSALAVWEAAGDPTAVGVSQRWLSRLSWFLGRNAESEGWAMLAVSTLEPLGPGDELAMAYSNVAQLRMLAGDVDGAVEWGELAIGLARRVQSREAEIHALNNVGTALWTGRELPEGRAQLARSLDLALAADAHEHAARAYTNLSTAAVGNRRYAEADLHLRAGIAYCDERDLDSWRLYMTAWLARSAAEQGRYAEADECAGTVLGHPHVSAIARIPAEVVAIQLALRRGVDVSARLDEVAALARPTGELQRLAPVAAARAEAAWLAGRSADVVAAVDEVWTLATRQRPPWELGELCWWAAVGGEPRPSPAPVAEPFALMTAGRWAEAAQAWRELTSPLWAAIAQACDPDLAAAREGLEVVEELGATAVHKALLRDRHARGLVIPRGRRLSTQGNAFKLTARELEVLHLVAEGFTNAEIAKRLFLSEKTVGHHVSAILRKLEEPTRARAVAAALRAGLVQPT
jgi:DNA-binding CsgD family transcriptional regulator/tetratricopeptide (TPR) repeat protein